MKKLVQKSHYDYNAKLEAFPYQHEAFEEIKDKDYAALFDANTINARTQTALAKLQKLQNADGSWSWWQGICFFADRLGTLFLIAGGSAPIFCCYIGGNA